MDVVKLKPAIKDYIWGGQYFKKYNKGLDFDRVSECWELSVREDASSIIVSGKDFGKCLKDVITLEDIGPVMERFPYFPLLIKLIDAADNLSVQVHPSDDYALKYENSFGKSEMWHIIDADQGCGIYCGLADNYSKADIEKALSDGTILNYLNFYQVKPGDTFLINPGTIHAIGKGVRLIEIQQNSNLTYRLFDYHRLDANGNPRELHVQKSLEVINLNKFKLPEKQLDYLADNQYFSVKKVAFDDELEIVANDKAFICFTIIDGEGMVNDIEFNKFDTFFVPYKKKALIKGKAVVVISTVR